MPLLDDKLVYICMSTFALTAGVTARYETRQYESASRQSTKNEFGYRVFFYLADEDGGTMLITDKFVFLHQPRAVLSLSECK